ncbi:MAG: hypothetical protein Q4G60_02405 [bacterium]|nr:hypothetical protein [bacterium]
MNGNIFQRADFSENQETKDKIRQKMRETRHQTMPEQVIHEMSEDDLAYVAAAGAAESRIPGRKIEVIR